MLTTVLAVDDYFMIHETVPLVVEVLDERLVVLSYGLLFTWRPAKLHFRLEVESKVKRG